MKRFQKPLALLLACALLAAGFAGCSSSSSDYLLDSGGERVQVKSVATIDGQPVTLSEFRANVLPMLDLYSQQMGPEVWDQYPEMFSAVADGALDNIRWERAAKKFAETNNIKMTEKEQALEIDAYISKMKEQMGGDVAYAGQLAQAGYTETTFRAQLELQPYFVRLQNEIMKDTGAFTPADDALKTEFQANYLHAKHILIANTDETGAARDTTEVDARAEEALARVKNGEDFDALIQEYGEDPGMIQQPGGYYFKEGDMVTEFYDATMALADNATSGLVSSQFGYHIIQRLPLEDSYFDSVKADMKRSKAEQTVTEGINALIAEIAIEKTPEFSLITAANIRPVDPKASSSAPAAASSSSAAASSSTSSAA